ncbi:UDP-N-acetylgalactosamine-undecaprenyl-phosphate N-acetylgalactosaminephosphotransferase [Pontiella desulfatans]|uniref:UDP-N-acetylgalactosamine-undecaprenyl-phosphate N-acetylgalactosaminephosphotransferase n=1 Tax=Pontiella desulfatans TaxID=2750659 RepID=A0A6C2TX35_PONDE|nr:exopolysaccharide biosynthesis polyprenyl glycosylphosphotransferase [Pontiella desulfatans]VGO12163.1 UDP-N-acetylgalactosamine-undecaprenyl-phosphate N-acetylgalactosaminephosphotransferase [Pontiella desulfatans]
MKRSRTFLYLMATDWIILVGTFAVALYFRPYDPGMNIVSRHHIVPEMVLVFIHSFVMLGVFSALGLYKRKTQLVPLQHFVAIIKAIAITLAVYILAKGFSKSDLFIHSRWVMIYWGSLLLPALALHRLLILRILCTVLSRTDMRRRVVVIGDTALSEEFITGCCKKHDCGMKVVGMMDDVEKAANVSSVPFIGSPSEMPDVTDLYNLEGAVICNPELSHQKLMDLIENCIRLFGWVDVHSDKSAALQRSDSADAHFDIPFIRMHGIPGGFLLKSWKRIFDFIASLIGIILLSPLLIGTAIAIKLTSPGPVFYTKDRIGRNGKPFPFYKFRSMAVGADQDQNRNDQIKNFIQNQQEGETLSKVVNTAYVTPVGKFIRKWAIDELPQLFNVLKGDMALVGPRPVPPGEYEMEDEWHQRRFAISPGCTGLWKLYAAKTGVTFNDTVLYDIYYARNMNPAMDLMVIFGTVWIILAGRADG